MTSPIGRFGPAGLVMAVSAIAALLVGCDDTPVAIKDGPAMYRSDPGIADVLSERSPLTSFYRSRAFRPIWDQGSAAALLAVLADAAADGQDPADFPIATLQSLQARPDRAAELDIALSQAFVAYVRALRTPSAPAAMVYVDAALAPTTDPTAILQAAAAAPSARDRMADARRMHPLYEALRARLASFRSAGRNPTTLSDDRYERLLLTNMDRLRALPADPGPKYILVDTASARLWMYEHGRPRDGMRVVVGKNRMQTPVLAGAIRFAVRNPYWNLPPDLTRERAAHVARDGPAVLEREQLEVLSGWQDDAQPVDPAAVDWPAAARGTPALRMRQLPGPANMMGAVKFMLPNRLGIYLHDTPDKTAFTRADRRLSSGCVRLEDAARLGRWLFDGSEPMNWGGPEDRADLPAPVPVYILHLTALPTADGVLVQHDGYGRDLPASRLVRHRRA